MQQQPISSPTSKRRSYVGILLPGALAGTAITMLAWLQKWTSFRAPHWLYAALFWAGVFSVLGYGIVLLRRRTSLSRLWVGTAVLAAIGLAWLFPETLAPGCGGMPRAFAHWENHCTTTCTTVCTWWVPLSNPTCAAEPHMPWDIGCCWAYGQSCTTSCNNVWVDDPPTVSGSVSCATPGNGGWCRGGASLDLSGSDPQGYALTISGSIGGTPFSCSGSCSQALPEGTGSASFTSSASGGGNLSSSTGSASYQVDTTAPSLALSIPSPDGSNGWFISGPVTASASATDATSGLAGVNINGGGTTFTASSDGTYPLTATATDNASNSTTASGTIKVDTTPPSLSVSVSPADGSGGWYRTPAVFTATASDATSGLASVQFSVDGGAWQDGTTATVSADGTHTVQFQARDLAGNSTTSSPVTAQVDTIPPIVAASLPAPDGQNGWYVSPLTITANSSDAVSGLASQGVSLDGSSWSPAVTISTDGVYTFQVQAQDNAGNSASSSQTFRLDSTAPEASLVLPPSDGENGWYVSAVTVTADGSDATSGVASQLVLLDGSNWSASLTLSDDGVYTLQGRVIDNAGNANTISQTIHIDHTQPVLTAPTLGGSSGLSGWYTSSVQFDSSASDATSGLSSLLYMVDGGTWQAGPLTLTDGRHTVQVQATDQAGNTSFETQTVDVDSTPPQSGFVSPAEGSVSFAHGTDFMMSGQSSDATSGMSTAQISLDGGSTWQPIPLASDGSWFYTWNTTSVSNGPHLVFVEAVDQAGNQEHTAKITVVVANVGPSVSLPDSFWAYQKVDVGFSAGILPITGARITISDGGDHHRTFNYSGSSLPSSFQWDGKWEDGTWARPGSYQVGASAWDMFGNTGRATATVRVPSLATQTPTPTSTPTSTPSPTGTPIPTAFPTLQPPTPAAPIHLESVTHQEPPPVVHSQPVLLWPVFGFVALLAALASASLSDPRPRALKRLAQTLDSIQDDQS